MTILDQILGQILGQILAVKHTEVAAADGRPA